MDSKAIRQALISRGFTYALIAEQSGISATTLSSTANRSTTSFPAASAIAKCLGKSLKEVFPDVPGYHSGIRRLKLNNEQKKQKGAEIAQLLAG
jgi:transcriptional regulator with XRE-family HTH domain